MLQELGQGNVDLLMPDIRTERHHRMLINLIDGN